MTPTNHNNQSSSPRNGKFRAHRMGINSSTTTSTCTATTTTTTTTFLKWYMVRLGLIVPCVILLMVNLRLAHHYAIITSTTTATSATTYSNASNNSMLLSSQLHDSFSLLNQFKLHSSSTRNGMNSTTAMSFQSKKNQNITTTTATTTTLPSIDIMKTSVPLLSNVHEPIPRPPFHSIVTGRWNITGDASWLLNFAIVGFPKCGTSTLMHHLENHDEMHVFDIERCDLTGNQQATLIRDLYHDMPKGSHYVRGIKCPQDVESTQLSIQAYQTWFPSTKFIVGVRHPILWFESFYNFRIHNHYVLPPPQQLIGPCGQGSYGCCTDRSNFHFHLSNLGKTPFTAAEANLMRKPLLRFRKNETHFQAPIFLYEISQLSDPDETRAATLRKDLQNFLGLNKPIPPFIWFKPGRNHTEESIKKVNSRKIDICDDQHRTVRKRLLEQAQQASTWISNHFLQSDTVYVSSPHYFVHVLMEKWKHDPCKHRGNRTKAPEAPLINLAPSKD
jgi:hypothetical protein